MSHQVADASCKTCNTLFENCAVERDEESGYAVITASPCHSCSKLLCASCDQFKCDGCEKLFCADHMISLPDGTETPLHVCDACWLLDAEQFLFEPECECATGGDLFDPRGCELHNSSSWWNEKQRAITAVQELMKLREVA
jgi:hypothetical protein